MADTTTQNQDTLGKHFDSAAIEDKWRTRWQQHNLFDSTPQPGRDNYCIMLPPPNVTGSLHMGHAFQHALMDALIRRARMRGMNVLWQAGTDHAGIATQIVVTRELEERGIRASDLSREEFLKHAWEWKKSSGGTITRQMRHLGASCDWTRERFTMDEGLSKVVTEIFVRLYEEGLIYRGKRLVNWDPVLLTAVSDLEVISSEEEGKMYYVRYPFVDNESEGVIIGTTRPETILVDGAVAVHPDDPRYQKLIGKKVWVPLTEPRRAIEVIADSHVTPEFGTGCVKITGAHDFNDYEICKRHPDKNIPIIVLMTPDAKMNENAPVAYRGLDRYDARERIVADLQSIGLLQKSETHHYKLPRGDRSGAVVEPMLTDQWFMNMEKMAAAGLAAAKQERVRFIPNNWRKVYDQWLEGIQDWCLSRQLIWGHRIPAWYDDEGNIYVARNEEDAKKQAQQKGKDKTLRRDDDVLDTWFSSAFWPFSTLDWPQTDNAHFRHYFPTSVLVTGFDIIFFWVARMVMMSEHLTGKSPFADVYITGLVRDATGQKMSKSKGNILDPLDLTDGADLQTLLNKRTSGLMNPKQAEAIAEATRRQFADGIPAFGVDALRFTFASLASYGRDIKFDLERCAGYRNFCNKMWNAARFVLGVCAQSSNEKEDKSNNNLLQLLNADANNTLAERWIISRLQNTIATVDQSLENYRFDLAATAVHHFLWNEYCDWYLEMAKLSLREGGDAARRTQQTLAQVLETALRLSHPLMPFITEELHEKIAPFAGVENTNSIMQTAWPTVNKDAIDKQAETEMQKITEAVEVSRRLRGMLGAPPQARPTLLFCGSEEFNKIAKWVLPLCGASDAKQCNTLPEDLPQATCNYFADELQIALDWRAPVADSAEVRSRLQKKLEKAQNELANIQKTLSDQSFLSRAPTTIVDKKRTRAQSLGNDIRDIQRQLDIA